MKKAMVYKTIESVFGEKFRACLRDEKTELQKRFKTFLEPLYVGADGKVLVAQNQFSASKSLAVDLFSGFRTNTNQFVVKYIGADESAMTYAGGGFDSYNWFDLKTLEETKEAATYATVEAAKLKK